MSKKTLLLAHVAIVIVSCTAIFTRKSTPGLWMFFFYGLFVAYGCLLGIWLAFSDKALWMRLVGFLAGVCLITVAFISLYPSALVTLEMLGLLVEQVILPLMGVAFVLLILRYSAFKLAFVEGNDSKTQPRISVSGILWIVTAVAVLLAIHAAIQLYASYDRIATSILTQTVSLSSLTLLALWAILSAHRKQYHLLIYAVLAMSIWFYVGYYYSAVPLRGFLLLQVASAVLATVFIPLNLAFLRRSGVRIVTHLERNQLVFRAAVSTLVVAGMLSGIDLLYGRYMQTESTKIATPLISDPTGELRRAAMKETDSAEKLVKLLRLNGEMTEIDSLAGMTGGTGTFHTIESAGQSYYVAIGRKSSSSSPPPMRQQMAKGYNIDWMINYSVACLFDSDGKLVTKLGGGLAADGINGDDVWLTTLGTSDRWFAKIGRFEKRPPYEYQTEIRLIEPGFPTAFVIYHFPNSTAFTNEPHHRESYFMFHGMANGAKMPSEAMGLGRDGKKYSSKIVWDPSKNAFVGASQLTYKGVSCFQVDLKKSARFIATDGLEE